MALAALFLVWAFGGRLASCAPSLRSPETQVREALDRQDRAQLDDVYGFKGGGTVELVPVHFSDVSPVVEGARATVVAMLEAEGRVVWRDQQASLAYVGRERFHMKRCAIAGWCGEGDQFDRLRGVLLPLFRRHDARQRGDAAAFERLLGSGYAGGPEGREAAVARLRAESASPARARVLGWQVRVERDGAEVGEDVEVRRGSAPPVRERRVSKLVRESERWVFASGA